MNNVSTVELNLLVAVNIARQHEQMHQQTLTATIEQYRDSFNISIALIKSTAAIRILSSVLSELEIYTKELGLLAAVLPKVSPTTLTLRGHRRNSSGHF